jgi:hypothetical protein
MGRLIAKEYPPASATMNHIRFLLKELELKRKFKPSVAIFDYLNLFAPARASRNDNTYTANKKVAEEMRAIAVEHSIAAWSATQGNRGSINSEDLSQSSVSESIGINFTADLIIGIINSEVFDQQGKYLFKQIKNRYADMSKMEKFFVSVEKAKMRISDPDDPAALLPDPPQIQLKQKRILNLDSFK